MKPMNTESKPLNIIHLIPGTGGSFYCENCVRDGGLVSALRDLGHNVTMVPLYLPLSFDKEDLQEDTPIFFGAISTYLKEKFPVLGNMPNWISKLLDSQPLLKYAAHKADSTRAAGLEDMTLSMLRGKAGNQSHEVEHLVQWIKHELKPDVIYLANALLLGLAESLKEGLDVPLVCAMEDEDIWLEDMEAVSLKKIWEVIEENSRFVDVFVPVSDYYKAKIQARLDIPPEKLRTVHIGIDLEGYSIASEPVQPRAIGYLSRLAEPLGLGILIEAFMMIKTDPQFSDLRLRLTGGETSDDQRFIAKMKQNLSAKGLLGDVDFIDHFDRQSRIEFLESISVLSVPMLKEEAFGVFLIEALAAGVPIVQPRLGGFPEIIDRTGGGICYEHNVPQVLAKNLASLLQNEKLLRKLGQQGRQAVESYFDSEAMAKRMVKVYRDVIKT